MIYGAVRTLTDMNLRDPRSKPSCPAELTRVAMCGSIEKALYELGYRSLPGRTGAYVGPPDPGVIGSCS